MIYKEAVDCRDGDPNPNLLNPNPKFRLQIRIINF